MKNKIIELNSVDSTNNYAEKVMKNSMVEEGTIIRAHEQTAGKGQGENSWISEAGKNITISIILYPGFLPIENQFMLNKAISLAVLDFVHTLLPSGSCKIKWPNDIYHGCLKLGGILINNTISGSSFDTSIIGIGVNINQTHFDPSIPNPTSIKLLNLAETNLLPALKILTGKLDHRYNQLKCGDYSQLDHEYRDQLLGFNENRLFKTGEVLFSGYIRDVDLFGRLIIETGENRRMTFAHKEVELLL